MKLPVFLKQGEAARLFPILADTSKGGTRDVHSIELYGQGR